MLIILNNQPALGILLYLLLKRNLENGEWLTDLRAVTKVIQPMGSLQSEIPLPSLLPKERPLNSY